MKTKWVRKQIRKYRGGRIIKCKTCGGVSGYPRNIENINRGYNVLETCPDCKGTGKQKRDKRGLLFLLIFPLYAVVNYLIELFL